jgi:N-acetylneuraminic acid mutarotase
VRRFRWLHAGLAVALTAMVITAAALLIATSGEPKVRGHLFAPNNWAELRYRDGSAPSKRDNGCMVYVPTVDRVILFGGNSAAGNDTWSLRTDTWAWTELHPSGPAPPGRYGPAYAVLDSPGSARDGNIVMFGGYNHGQKACINDTWLYDPVADTWTLAIAGDAGSTALPTPRLGASLEYDPATGRFIMFGGWNAALYKLFNDLWTYNPGTNTWTELYPEGPVPPVRDGEGFVRDPRSGKIILFAGVGFDAAHALVELGDTWSYDPVSVRWTQLFPVNSPSPRDGMLMVYDPGHERMLLFGGGEEGLNVKNDTWAYDPAANVWTDLAPTGLVPSARMNYNLAFDTRRRRAVLFGGAYDQWNVLLGDTWAYTPE